MIVTKKKKNIRNDNSNAVNSIIYNGIFLVLFDTSFKSSAYLGKNDAPFLDPSQVLSNDSFGSKKTINQNSKTLGKKIIQ